jgi:hypothetical protein
LKIKVVSTPGSRDTLLYDPVVSFNGGKVHVMAAEVWRNGVKYDLPEILVPAGGRVWLSGGKYSSRAHQPGDILVIWSDERTVYALSYHKPAAPSLLDRILPWRKKR